MSEKGTCASCLEYRLLFQTCGINSEHKKPFEEQCTEHPHKSMSQEVTEENLLSLALALRNDVGGKYFSLVPICDARKGLCPIEHPAGQHVSQDGKCNVNCENKTKFENP